MLFWAQSLNINRITRSFNMMERMNRNDKIHLLKLINLLWMPEGKETTPVAEKFIVSSLYLIVSPLKEIEHKHRCSRPSNFLTELI